MNLLELAAPVEAAAVHISIARGAAAVAFLTLLLALSWGLLRSRKQLRYDEADAALEADFQRLEREARK